MSDGRTCPARRRHVPLPDREHVLQRRRPVDPGGGSLVGVVGPSGAGKTTLLRAIIGSLPAGRRASVTRRRRPAGRLRPAGRDGRLELPGDGGRVRAHGAAARRLPAVGERGRSARWHARARAARDRRSSPAGTSASSRAGSSSASSSRGRCSAEPDLLVLDEPTSGVDARIRHEILHLLGDLNDEGLSIVLTTHDLNGIATHLPRARLPQPARRRGRRAGRGADARDARADVRRAHGRARAPRRLHRRRRAARRASGGPEHAEDEALA